jgi:hypothetical protein
MIPKQEENLDCGYTRDLGIEVCRPLSPFCRCIVAVQADWDDFRQIIW